MDASDPTPSLCRIFLQEAVKRAVRFLIAKEMHESVEKENTSSNGKNLAVIHKTGSKAIVEELGLPSELISKYRTFPLVGDANERLRSWKLCLDFMVPKCFEMIEGVGPEVLSSISGNLISCLKAEPRPIFDPRSRLYFKRAFQALDEYPWKWKEWEYWETIFASLNKEPTAISRYGLTAPELHCFRSPENGTLECGPLPKQAADRKYNDLKKRVSSEKEDIFAIFILTLLTRVWILSIVRM